MIQQQVITASLLGAIRMTEAQRGVELVHFYRAKHANRGTPRKLHFITNRAELKADARSYTPANPYRDLTPHLHSAQRIVFKRAA